jgi:Flp pilus assembly protein TadG
MKQALKAIGRRHQHGAIAVEMALVLPVLLLFLGFPSLFLALYFRQYSAAQKAVHDAALYLATAPRVEVTTSGSDGNFAAMTLAKKILEKEMAGIVPDRVSVDPVISCIYQVAASQMSKACTAALVKDVNHTLVQFEVSISFPYINPLTNTDTGMLISPYASVRYVGN